MTNVAKVTLSEFEAMLINNSEWILTKHSIMEKVSDLLSNQVNTINDVFLDEAGRQLEQLNSSTPKISKGERYKNLPYLILDYPALFSKKDVFALRTMFWWGNFISVTLHLSGIYKKMYEATIATNISKQNSAFYISNGMEEWEHHFEEDNYLAVSNIDKLTVQKKIMQPRFVKVALKYNLSEWNNINILLKEAYSSMNNLLQH